MRETRGPATRQRKTTQVAGVERALPTYDAIVDARHGQVRLAVHELVGTLMRDVHDGTDIARGQS